MLPFPGNKIPTGDSVSGNPTRFSFVAPNNTWLLEAIFGFFLEWCNPLVFWPVGAVTPDEAADVFNDIYGSLTVDVATIGAIVPFAGGILPLGWLPCDGRSLLISDYEALYAAIGTVWGSADSSHFNIPDLRGKTLIGQGTNPSTGTTFSLGGSAGEEQHTLSVAESPSHTHTDTGHTHTEGSASPTFINGGLEAPAPSATPTTSITGSGAANLSSVGGDGPHNNMQPYAVVNYAIIAG
jgi:microcystin-dependent protein